MFFPIKIALLGGESTGKSTLSQALHAVLGGILVVEFSRNYWIIKNGVFTSADMCFIALRQSRLERLAVARSNTYVICDTTPLTTMLYHHWTWSDIPIPQRMLNLVNHAFHTYHLTVLCEDDIPYEQDGLRANEDFRSKQQIDYQKYVQQLTTPYISVNGTVSNRIQQVLDTFNGLHLLLKNN